MKKIEWEEEKQNERVVQNKKYMGRRDPENDG
jgi:hypothetical protein